MAADHEPFSRELREKRESRASSEKKDNSEVSPRHRLTGLNDL